MSPSSYRGKEANKAKPDPPNAQGAVAILVLFRSRTCVAISQPSTRDPHSLRGVAPPRNPHADIVRRALSLDRGGAWGLRGGATPRTKAAVGVSPCADQRTPQSTRVQPKPKTMAKI